MFGVEVPDEPRETALGGTHGLKRNVHYLMSDEMHRAAQFSAREGGEVDMREDKLHMRDLLVEALAFAREYARAAPRFILRERKKAGKKPEGDKGEDKICHGV